ncbi:hypothetical protein WR25_08542 [Diploscapter pachys]|uniref:Uncharacterized protein n=1 Tax=Diploscapter pachys TaxID=2018661 RepID=A0A2A2LX27_9BILA|nr:hypothetical protein WR25_08542 [Diploscapter pachys]
MAGLVRTGQIQGEIPGMQHSDLHSLQLPYTGLTPSSPLRRSPPRTAPCSPFIRSDYVSSSPVHPVHSAAVSHSASAFMFPPPPLSAHSQQPWMNPVPLHSTSVSNPWPQPMESARSGLSRSHSTRLPVDLPALSSGNQLPANIYGSMGIQMDRMQVNFMNRGKDKKCE